MLELIEIREIIENRHARLPDCQARILMAYASGGTVAEVALEAGVSEPTVRASLARSGHLLFDLTEVVPDQHRSMRWCIIHTRCCLAFLAEDFENGQLFDRSDRPERRASGQNVRTARPDVPDISGRRGSRPKRPPGPGREQ